MKQTSESCEWVTKSGNIWLLSRPLSSHGFTVCHMISLPFLRSHGRFFISPGFSNFKWIFSQTHNFLRIPTRQHNPLSKKYSIVLYIQKINNSVTFHSETSSRSSPGNDCPVNYQKFYEKDPSSINLIKSALFRESFCNNLEISLNCYEKWHWSVSIKETQYLNKNFCNIDLNNFLIIFFFMYRKHEHIIGFIFWDSIFRYIGIFWKLLQKNENGRIIKINQCY